ncbi:DUF6933 domain-containing protein [Algoriphagus terrigena]|uniref:DUF6933 domain-containing protein n=1 Tax=Algoriphagus terrigena TaxID=344884 RepID=UPI0004223F1C|nr:hypothetical protein [Algoriphagus terrigena]
MSTAIYVSKKLEKLIKKYITNTGSAENIGILGKWNATVFFTNRRKNWLLYNPKSHYSLILENLSAKDLPNIREVIAEEFQLQLTVDGIDATQAQVNWLLDEINFLPTDADRSATAHINQLLFIIEFHQHTDYYKSLAEINLDLNDRIFSLDGSSKYTRLTKPREEMEKILNLYLASKQDRPTDPSQLN